MNNFMNDTLDNFAEQGRQFELEDFNKIHKLKERIQYLKFLLYAKEQELDEMYTRICIATEFMLDESDRRRMRAIIKYMERSRRRSYKRNNNFLKLESVFEKNELDFWGQREEDEYNY